MCDPKTEIADTRWAMGLGIKAGKVLGQAEQSLASIRAHAFYGDDRVIRELYDARRDLNLLAREILDIIRLLQREQEKAQSDA